MGLMGRYTTYVGGTGATDAHAFLAKLFPGSADYPTVQAIQAAIPAGDEVAAQAVIKKNAIADVDAAGVGGLHPTNGFQQGDLGMFPQGVQRGYGGSPDITQVKWTSAGGPANPYAPDITSPGPGKTEGSDKSVDPKISIADLQEFSTTSDPSGQNLRVPSHDAPLIYANTSIGTPQVPGDSGANV